MEHLIEFKGKKYSWDKYINLLCKERNIYIMDNHFASIWCWLQEIDLNERYNILHIDRHYDTRYSHIDKWIENIPTKLHELGIEDFISLKYDDPNFENQDKIMYWDNYFPIFHRLYKENINKYHFITHKDGTVFPEMEALIEEYPIKGLFNLMDYLFDKENTGNFNWIVNIDLDYFFQQIEGSNITFRFITYKSIDFFLDKINKYLNKKRISVITIALSPECCGNWENSLELMRYFSQKLEIDFNIK